MAIAGLSWAVAALVWSPLAVADPPAPDPATVAPAPPPAGYVPPPSGIGSALAQSDSTAAGPLGLPDLAAYTPGLLLGQNAVPAAPGTPASATAPDLRAFNGDYLLPQNIAPAAPGPGCRRRRFRPHAAGPRHRSDRLPATAARDVPGRRVGRRASRSGPRRTTRRTASGHRARTRDLPAARPRPEPARPRGVAATGGLTTPLGPRRQRSLTSKVLVLASEAYVCDCAPPDRRARRRYRAGSRVHHDRAKLLADKAIHVHRAQLDPGGHRPEEGWRRCAGDAQPAAVRRRPGQRRELRPAQGRRNRRPVVEPEILCDAREVDRRRRDGGNGRHLQPDDQVLHPDP